MVNSSQSAKLYEASNSHYDYCGSIPEKPSIGKDIWKNPTEPEKLKQPRVFDTIVGCFRQVLSSLPDKRTGKNNRYGMEDAGLSAFSVFFTQTPSFLAYQRMMAGSKGKSNAQSLVGVHQIPSDKHIRDLLDPVKPEQVFPMFEEILQVLEQQGQ